MAGLAVAWSDPSPDLGSRDEVLLELFYRFQLSPSLYLSPDLQLILEPEFVAIAGVRLQLAF
jgi:carbohydrate-selective porin OprB